MISQNLQPGDATGTFTVMMVAGHPVLHSQFVESLTPGRGEWIPAEPKFGWREVTLADMMAYQAFLMSQKQAVADARIALFHFKRRARFYLLFSGMVAVYEIAEKMNHVLTHFGVI